MTSLRVEAGKPGLLVLSSTYPRWAGDHEPGFVHELSRRLATTFQVTVVTPHSPGACPREVMDGVEVIRYRYAPARMETMVYGGGMAANLRRSPWKALALPGFLVGMYLAARSVLRSRPVTAIHAHWLLPQGLVARRLGKVFGVPFLVTSHGGDMFGLRGKLPTRMKRQVALSAAAMTVVSTAMREEAGRLELFPPSLEVLPMGVDFESRFIPDPGVERDRDRLLFVGRLVPKKGLRHLLDALPIVAERRSDVTLDIVGFGPEERALREQVNCVGISRRVNFIGSVPQRDLPALYRRAALFVGPFIRDATGDQEGLPVALMEAIGCGCPAVVGIVAGLEDLLGDEMCDVSVDPRNASALAQAIIANLEHPEFAEARALKLREAAVRKVDWGPVAAGYTRVLERMVATHGAPRPRGTGAEIKLD